MKYKIKKYSLEFIHPFTSRGMHLWKKKGYFLTLLDDYGEELGLGELSHIPGVHEDDLEVIKIAVEAFIGRIPATSWNPNHFDECAPLFNLIDIASFEDLTSPAKFCIEGALLSWISRHYNTILTDRLKIDVKAPLPVNGLFLPITVGRPLSTEVCKQVVDDCIKRGITILKVKIGNQDLIKDNKLIKLLITLCKDRLTLRLDGNRKFSQKTLVQLFEGIDATKIDYIEEPLSNPDEYLNIHEVLPINLAIDESLPSMLEQNRFPLNLKAWVIKPTLDGGFSHTFRMIKKANMMGLDAVVSSTFEARPGIKLLGMLARFQNRAKLVPCCLDTLKFFKNNR